MTTIQLILCYYCMSGIYSYCIVQPKSLENGFNKWCERHKDEEEYLQRRQQLIMLIDTLQAEQPFVDIIALIFGWFIAPYSIAQILRRKLSFKNG